MWFTIVELIRPKYGYSLAVIKSTRRYAPPKWITALGRYRSSSEIVRLSDIGVVLRGEGRTYIDQYIGKWMSKEKFLKVMEEAIRKSYKSENTINRMIKAVRDFAEKPLERLGEPTKRRVEKIYELPPEYPTPIVASNADKEIKLYGIVVYVFKKTIHVSPLRIMSDCATVVIPRDPNSINDIELSEDGFRTLEKLVEQLDDLEEEGREVAEEIKTAIALAKLMS
jgi:hypothetical protein